MDKAVVSMTGPIDKSKFDPLSYARSFNEEAKKIQENEQIAGLFSRALDGILKNFSEGQADANQVLDSLVLLNRSYKTIQEERGKIKEVASKVIGQSNTSVKIIAFAKKIVEEMNVNELALLPNVVSQLIALDQMIIEQQGYPAKDFREVATVKIRGALEFIFFSNRDNPIKDHTEFNLALEKCNKITQELIVAGWKKEGAWLKEFIGMKFGTLKITMFNPVQYPPLFETIANDAEEPDAGNKIGAIIEEVIRSQQIKIMQDPDITREVFATCNAAVEALKSTGRDKEVPLLQSRISNTMKEIAERFISSRKEQITEDHTIALRDLESYNHLIKGLIEKGDVKAAYDLQFLAANMMKEIAEKFISDKEEQILGDPKIAIRACQLCSMAARMLIGVSLNKEALAVEALTRNISFIEQKHVEEFILNNQERIAKDPAFALRAYELCDKTAQNFLDVDLTGIALDILSLAAKSIPVPNPQSHPLYDLKAVFQQLRNRQLDPELGARVSGLDTGILKGGSLSIKERNIKNRMTACLDFTVNPVRRKYMDKYIEWIQANPEKFFQSLPSGLCKSIKIHEKKEYCFKFADEDKVFSDEKGLNINTSVIEIEFEGLGKVIVCKNPKCLGLYNAISIELEQYLESEQTIEKLNQMVTSLGLGPIFQLQRPEDDERMKIGQLFKAYYPAKSYEMERTAAFYELPLEELRKKMTDAEKGMEKIFKKYLQDQPELMKKEEIYPGEAIWTVGDLSAQLKERGALGFVAVLAGEFEEKEGIEKLKSIIKNGALSTMERFRANIKAQGQSSITDISYGSAGEVYSRMLTKRNIAGYQLGAGKRACYVLFDLDIVNRVGYGWAEDLYGSKVSVEYSERENPIDLLDHNPDLKGNEHMSKKRVQPEKLRLVLDKSLKELLIEELSQDGLIEEHEEKKYIKLNEKLVLVDQMLLEKGQELAPEMF